MKVKVIKTKKYAAALLPDGSVLEAGSEQELTLRLACRTGCAEAAETATFGLRGKKGMKEAVLATVGSPDPGPLFYAFCAAYLAEGKPALSYAYMTETADFGTVDFLPGKEVAGEPTSRMPYEHRRVQSRFIEKVMRHPLYRKVKEMIAAGIYGAPNTGWKDLRKAAAEILKWDCEKDAKEILMAALANPALK